MTELPVTFAALLRELRTGAGLTQEELAEAAGLSPRSISDLERGVNLTARKDTARLLADALHLTGTARAQFEAVARGRAVPGAAEMDALTGGVATAVRTLPRDIGSFTGRQRELRELLDAAVDAAESGGVVGIHAIGGMAGVGKTAFAVHAAHLLAERFTGGQIFLPLHGHTPGQQPTDPGDALAGLLLTIGVPAGQIPPGLEARIALWRDRLAEQQLLLVLDDAVGSEQVRPLLPGAGGSLVLITSRRHLSALEDATAISLDTLPPNEAADLVLRLSARPGLSSADPAVAEITRLCGYLPLAIGMMARQLHHHPAWTSADLAADLAAARDRLELMTTENLSVAAAFNLSYADLTVDQQQLFRRLGLHLGTDIDGYAAAALDGTDLVKARRQLRALYDHYLLAEPTRGRYRLHDLVRNHARVLAGRLDSEREREQAIDRLMDYYQHVADRAEAASSRQTRPAADLEAVTVPASAPVLADRQQALAWARAERANLLACLDKVTETGRHARVIALTAGLAALLRQDGPWTEAIARHAIAVRAAQELGNRSARANALDDLGDARRLAGDFAGAVRALEEGLSIYRDIGSRLGQANALNGLGTVRRATGDYRGAAETANQALGIYRDIGDYLGQANALSDLGIVRRLAGEFPGSARAMEQALGIYRDIGNRLGQANALNGLGMVRELAGDYPGAAQVLAEACAIHRDIGNRLGQANTLNNLGMVRRQTGDYPGAAQVLAEALAIHRDIGNRRGEANALFYLGIVRRAAADYPGAAQALEEALSICRDIGDRGGEVTTLNEAGALHEVRGDLGQARWCHRQALDLAREIGSSWDEAQALAGLGTCALAIGDIAGAEDGLRQALEIFRRIGAAAEVSKVTAGLDAMRGATHLVPDGPAE